MGNARQKLNIAYVNGCLLVSIVFGVLCEAGSRSSRPCS